MSTYQTGYNYHPNDRVWYYDRATSGFKEGRCYQVEIKIYSKQDTSDARKLSYLIALNDKPLTLRVNESDLYLNTDNGLILGPTTPIYNAIYDFDPPDTVWVIDRNHNAVKFGTVYQTEIKVSKVDENKSVTKVSYYVQFNDNGGTVLAEATEVFESSTEAWAALGIVIAPTPTPTPDNGGGEQPSSGNTTLVSKVNTDSVALIRGMPVYIKPIDGSVARASGTVAALTFLGFVWDEIIPVGGSGNIITEGLITLTVVEWNNVVDGVTDGLITGERYFLGSVGNLTSTAPTTGYSKQVGLAASQTQLDIRLGPAFKL